VSTFAASVKIARDRSVGSAIEENAEGGRSSERLLCAEPNMGCRTVSKLDNPRQSAWRIEQPWPFPEYNSCLSFEFNGLRNRLASGGAAVETGTYAWLSRFHLMREYVFEPMLTLKGGAVVRTLDDAVAFLVGYKEARWPLLRDSILRRLEGADDDQEQREAANAFRGFAEFEGLLQA
jgi:hypothetical protein